MQTRESAITATIQYFDTFDFAPTLLEVEKWLLKNESPSPTLAEIQHILDTNPAIKNKQGYYFLAGQEALVQTRKQKYDYTDQKWKHAKPFLNILALMPHVKAIWFSNSMGWGNAKKSSDIDLIIVTTPKRIWSARFFTTALMKILRQRPHEQQEEKALCLSFFMTDDHFNLQQYKIGPDDVHFTFWATQFYPVYDPENLFDTYKRNNAWINESFTNLHWTTTIQGRNITLGPIGRTIKKILELFSPESLLRKIQMRIMPDKIKNMANKDNRVVINDHILKLHTNDRRIEQQTLWEAKTH